MVALEFFDESIAQARLIDGDSPKSNFRLPDHGMTPAVHRLLLTEIFVRTGEIQPIACAPPIPGVKP